MTKWIAGIIALILAGCSGASNAARPERGTQEQAEAPNPQPAATQPPVSLDNLGPAPELENEVWLNTDVPIRLADLRGQVVLLDMWTFG
ncbi:MAG TPA: hypothetical protein VGA03_06915 [Anaerolineales bacterium]